VIETAFNMRTCRFFPAFPPCIVACLRRSVALAFAAGLAFAPAPARAQNQPTGVILGLVPQTVAGVDAGELLLAELNCVACHNATAPVKNRLASKRPPTLGEGGIRITPQYLRDFLANPHGDKPGTTMPDLMHGLSAAEKSEAVEALTHFLTSVMPASAAPAQAGDLVVVQRGRQLFHSVGCVACHAPQESAAAVTGKSDAAPGNGADLEALRLVSVPLGNQAKKTTLSELAKFLMNPLKVRPSGRMPSFNLNQADATAIAAYLQRAQLSPGGPGAAVARSPGMKFEYFEGPDGAKINFDKDKVLASGSVEAFTLQPAKRKEHFGLRFTGVLTIAKAGEYTFYTTSDDGSHLYVDDKLVVDNGGTHAPQDKSGKITLNAGEHALKVTFFNGGAGAELKVSYAGPGIKKQEIPKNILSHLAVPMVPLGETKFVLDDAKIARGKELFVSMSCAACHQIKGVPNDALLGARELAKADPAAAKSCIADTVPKGLPQFYLTAAQRGALRCAPRSRTGRNFPNRSKPNSTSRARSRHSTVSRAMSATDKADRSRRARNISESSARSISATRAGCRHVCTASARSYRRLG
jgi:mono/diheme cytochrome c family protein